MRGIGWTLRRLHDGRHAIEADPRDDKYLPNAIVERARKQGYRPQAAVPTHGDVGPTNSVVWPGGAFRFFIDFEEFGLGDPLADLMVACVEFTVRHPAQADMILGALERSYFIANQDDPRLSAWRDAAQMTALAGATLDLLEAWAPRFGEHEAAELYRRHRQRVLDAFAIERLV